MKTTLKVPSLFTFNSADAFLKELIALNQERRGFSQRGLSTRLKWPVSYIPDVIKKRRKFTITRAMQLGRYLALDPIDMEKIIMLAVVDMGYVTADEASEIGALKSNKKAPESDDQDMINAHLVLVFDIVKWLKNHATLENLVAMGKRQLSEAEVKQALRVLTQKKLLNLAGGKYVCIGDSITFDRFEGNDASVHVQFLDFMQKFFAEPTAPAALQSSIVHIDREHFGEVADRVMTLRNWLHEISKKYENDPFEKDVRLFQIDLNITPVFTRTMIRGVKDEALGKP